MSYRGTIPNKSNSSIPDTNRAVFPNSPYREKPYPKPGGSFTSYNPNDPKRATAIKKSSGTVSQNDVYSSYKYARSSSNNNTPRISNSNGAIQSGYVRKKRYDERPRPYSKSNNVSFFSTPKNKSSKKSKISFF